MTGPAEADTPTLVLVHSPLTGAGLWQPVAEVLRARGYRVTVPELAEALRGTGPYHPRLAAKVTEVIPGSGEFTLVGHSGAGALLPAAAAATGGRIAGTVYVDALLPHPGHSWLQTAPPQLRDQLVGLADNGLLPPWHEWFPPGTVEALLPDPDSRARFLADLPRLPLAYFREPAPQSPELAPQHCAYLRLSEAYEDAAAHAERTGCRVRRLTTHHLSPLTSPQDVAAELVRLLP